MPHQALSVLTTWYVIKSCQASSLERGRSKIDTEIYCNCFSVEEFNIKQRNDFFFVLFVIVNFDFISLASFYFIMKSVGCWVGVGGGRMNLLECG